MDAIALLREQIRTAHEYLEGTMEGVTAELAHWAPPGTANSIGANYAHVVLTEDFGINSVLRGGQPLSAGAWARRLGLSEVPAAGPGVDYHDWGRRVRIDLPALRAYGRAVYAATDEYVSSLGPNDLDRPVDMPALGLGQWTVGRVLSATLWNASGHCGEISCLKGQHGLRGYPA